MKLLSFLLSLVFISALLMGCSAAAVPAQVAATTLPVYDFTARLCENTPVTVTRLVTEEVSCLHDYSLNVRQVKAAESAELIVISGAGLEEFLDDILVGAQTIDASAGIDLIIPEEHGHDHDRDAAPEEHDHEDEKAEDEDDHGHEGHHHEQDPHIWLSPANAMTMSENICRGLQQAYPEHSDIFASNLDALQADLTALQIYAEESLHMLSCRDIITFHDGFSYLAQACDLHILDAIEEESGSEASAKELIHMIEEVEHHNLPAVFTEKNGSVSAAGIISRETGAAVFSLDMVMTGESYLDAMYANINTLKEALQ